MSANKAIDYFLGRNGHSRVNCAQAVLSTFQERFEINPEVIEEFAAYGGGKAPDGLCGAFYAVKYLQNNLNVEEVENFEQNFIQQAGSTKCKEIKGFKKFSCIDCVSKCADFLEKPQQ